MAELICDWVPSIEKVRMVNSGTEGICRSNRGTRPCWLQCFTGTTGRRETAARCLGESRYPTTTAATETPDERVVLAKTDPELLQLLDELDARPYATINKLRQAEAQRQAIMAIPYGEKEHQLNPFKNDNQTARAQFMKRDPELAAFYEREAKDVEVPIFGRHRNMTIEAKLLRDPSTAALVRVAEQIARQWNAEDVATAKEQRAAAELALKKLEGAAA
jgi:hypothetical protein